MFTYHYNTLTTTMNTVNVLCLHGCNQDAEMFERLLKDLVAIGNKENIKFHFMEAKYDHPLGLKTWYKIPLNVPDIGRIEMNHDMVDDTLNDLEAEIDKLNITALLGFSQGANAIDTYLAYKHSGKIKCAVMMSGYSLVDPNRQKVDVPVLNILSHEDVIVPSKYVSTEYVNSTILEHNKGHKLPSSKPQLRQIISFIKMNS